MPNVPATPKGPPTPAPAPEPSAPVDPAQAAPTPPDLGPTPAAAAAGAAPAADAGVPGHPGPDVAYFAFKLDGPDGKPAGLFRIADDSEAEVLTMERFDPSGEWVDDPTLIDDLHEPGCYSVNEQEAQSIQDDILGATPAGPEKPAPDPPAATPADAKA